MRKKQRELSVNELLKNAYEILSERNKNREIVFSHKILTEIASDNDWHKNKIGYMVYKSARAFEFNNKTWIIARGEKCRGYPAECYDSDILALESRSKEEMTKIGKKELEKRIGESKYFRNSLIYGMVDGNIAVNENGRFAKKMLNLLKPKIEDYIAQKPEYDYRMILLSTMQNPPIKVMLYKPKFSNFLAESFETILKSE
jgi:hypothetical protein